MAIVKNNYVKRNGRERANAKATIRYIQHRTGKDGERMHRTLFGNDGIMERQLAYRMIDEAEGGSVFYRFIISPDAKTEDTQRDLRLREITEKTMLKLEEQCNQQVQWVASIHEDHSSYRHAHIVAVVPGRLPQPVFRDLPRALREAATEACLEQRQELDRAREPAREQAGGGEWQQGY